jgi:hypothetical protein
MKILYTLVLSFIITTVFSQEIDTKPEKFTAHNKGKFYVFWGGNRENFSKSDITFKGDNYNFTVEDVVADDKPKGWHLDYVNPSRMTIPQTNLRIGYFITDHYNISIGLDHMKYVVRQTQTVPVSGYINVPTDDAGSIYNGTYSSTQVNLFTNFDENDLGTLPPFLTFEHTDGLNYVNSELSRVDDISKFFKIGNTDTIQLNLTEGIGAGLLYPKTNSKIIGKERYDEFHVSGFGLSAKVGLNITFFKYFFLQTEIKGGFVSMKNIRTTTSESDSAQQNFYFLQRIIAFGGIFNI